MSNLEKLKKKLLIYRVIYYLSLFFVIYFFSNAIFGNDVINYTFVFISIIFAIVVYVFGKLIKKLKKNIYDISVIKSAIDDANKS